MKMSRLIKEFEANKEENYKELLDEEKEELRIVREEKEFKKMVSELGGTVIQLDPSESSKFNPLAVVDSKITVKDLQDSFGNIKPFEVVNKATGISLEMYQRAVSFIRTIRSEIEQTKRI